MSDIDEPSTGEEHDDDSRRRSPGSIVGSARNRIVRRLGLRSQIVASFAIGTLILCSLFSVAAYSLTRTSLLERRTAEALASASANAATVNRRLSATADLSRVIDNLNTPEGTQPLLRIKQASATRDEWLSPNPLGFFEDDVHVGLLVAVDIGNAARMRYAPAELLASEGDTVDEAEQAVAESSAERSADSDTDGAEEIRNPDEDVHIVIGIPLPGTRPPAQYFEATSLRDVDEDLSSLAFTLIGVSSLTTLAGLWLGFFLANRTLRPLREISEAAQDIAGGDLSTRLDEEADRDLRVLTHSFNNMASNLEEKVERDARFASEVSHELRSPLMTLTASAAVLEKRKDELPEKAQVAVELLSTDISRFKQLVEDLLEISRYDVGAASLETQPVHINEFTRQAAAFVDMLDVPILCAPEAAGLFVDLDKRRIAQVLRNLLENAAKYAGGATAISIERDLDAVLIAVEDKGPGVPLKERAAIFDRFSRGAEGGRRGSGTGVGLGLSLVREHVRLHGGDVWVTDRIDGESGSRFIVRLPGVIEAPPEPELV